MRILIWHLDYFKSEVTEKGRSPLREEVAEDERVIEAHESLLVYAACEKSDEAQVEIIVSKCADEITKLARQLKVNTIVLHSFAHLFVELAAPQVALDILKGVQAKLTADGFTVLRTPFGWFNTLDLKAKGHPISRVARAITAA
jgi:threonyl-tRNA synthetase